MKRIDDEDLERLLRLRPAPAPPASLAARIKAERPVHLPAGRLAEAEPLATVTAEPGIERRLRVAGMVAASLLVATALALLGLGIANRPEGSEVQRVSLVTGEEARALIRVESVSDPTPAQAAAMREVAIDVAVVGPDRLPRPGERVAVEPVSPAGHPLELLTDRRGWARAAGLVPGTYRLRCSLAPGAVSVDEITLRAGERAALLLPLPSDGSRPTPVG
jgi:hypothetical protein